MKTKLTLTVEKDIVDAAKKQLKISDFVEKMLGGFVAANKPNVEIYEAYDSLFTTILPLVQQFNIKLKIGEGEENISYNVQNTKHEDCIDYSIFLESSGDFYVDWFDTRLNNIRKIHEKDFLPPEIILSNLIDSLWNQKEIREKKILEILMVKNIVSSISISIKGKSIAENYVEISKIPTFKSEKYRRKSPKQQNK